MNHLIATRVITTPAKSLSIDRDNIADRVLMERRDPFQQALFELLRVKCTEDSVNRIAQWDPIRQVEKLRKPVFLLTAYMSDHDVVIGPANDGRDGNHEELYQRTCDLGGSPTRALSSENQSIKDETWAISPSLPEVRQSQKDILAIHLKCGYPDPQTR